MKNRISNRVVVAFTEADTNDLIVSLNRDQGTVEETKWAKKMAERLKNLKERSIKRKHQLLGLDTDYIKEKNIKIEIKVGEK